MSSGIEIINANGNIQITESFRNLHFVDKGTVTIPAPTSYGFKGHAEVYLDDISELVAFRCEPPKWATVFFRPFIRDGKKMIMFCGEEGAVVTYYRFSFNNNPAGHCFEIRDASSNVVFSDSAKYMKIIGSQSGTYVGGENESSTGGTIATVSHSSDIKAAVLVGNNDLTYMAYQSYDYFCGNQAYIFNSNNVNSIYGLVGHNSQWDYYGPYTKVKVTNYSFLVLDVTNY